MFLETSREAGMVDMMALFRLLERIYLPALRKYLGQAKGTLRESRELSWIYDTFSCAGLWASTAARRVAFGIWDMQMMNQ